MQPFPPYLTPPPPPRPLLLLLFLSCLPLPRAGANHPSVAVPPAFEAQQPTEVGIRTIVQDQD
jgi:hypothetical protein